MKNKPKCIYFDCLGYSSANIELISEAFIIKNYETPFDRKWTSDNDAPSISAIFCPLQESFNESTLKKFTNLQALISNTTSIPHIDVDYAGSHDIIVCALHDEQQFLDTITPTSELTIGLIINATRNIREASNSVLEGHWDRKDWGGEKMLSRSTLGIIGYGRIGKHVAKIARSIGMRIKWYDPYLNISSEERVGSLEDIAKESDVITLHASANSDNREMINSNFFESIKPDNKSIFVNTARGELVSNKALIDALHRGLIKYAALDTINGEFTENFRKNINAHELVQYAKEYNNLVLTPHIAGSTKDSWHETEKYVIMKGINVIQT